MANADDSSLELLELLEAAREERATQEQLDRIEAIVLDDAASMDEYIRFMAMAASLRHRLQGLPRLAESAVGARREASATVVATVPPKHRPKWQWAAGLSLAATIALVAVVWFSRPDPTPSPGLAILTQIVGDVRVITGQHESRATEGTANIVLGTGDTVKTVGTGSSAVLTYPDGTRLVLVNDSSVTCVSDERKSVVLHHGIITAQVTGQTAGKPMLLATPGAKVEVLGTQFALAASTERTELNVTQGRVRLTRVSDGRTIEVAQGQGVITNGEAALVVHDSPGPRETWDADFEQGVPKGWTGSPTTTALPAGSRGAVAAVRLHDGGEHVIHGIVSRQDWVEGLFAVHAESHLHITLKMERPDWLNVFMSTRGGDPTNPTWALHNFNKVPYWPPKAGQWRTVTIPLTQFRRKRNGIFQDEPPIIGEVAYSVSISATEPDRGLVIDRIWVTRGGPGEVTAVVLP